MKKCVEQRTQVQGKVKVNLISIKTLEHHEVTGGTIRVVMVIVQVLSLTINRMSSVQMVYTNQDSQTNIRFDEIEDSQALGDLTLSNKSGKKVNQRFKLDS